MEKLTLFNIGDRVRCIKSYDKQATVDQLGTIIGITIGTVTVEYDIDIRGHEGLGSVVGRAGHCWNYSNPPEYLVHVDEAKHKSKDEVKIIKPTDREVNEALDFVRSVYNDPHSYYKDHLTPQQLGLVKQIRKNPKKIFGEAVVYKNNNIYYIAGWTNDPGRDFLMLINYDGGTIGRGELEDCHPVRDTFALRPSEIKAYDQIRTFSTISNEGVKNFRRIDQKKNTSLAQIQDKKGEIKNLEEYVERLGVLEKGASETPLSTPEIVLRLEELRKMKKVANAYITNGDYLVVETATLTLTPNADEFDEYDGETIGRFALCIPLVGTNGTRIINRTHCYHKDGDSIHYHHPNVSGDIPCFGENDNSLFSMRSAGNYYSMVDFLILFLSLFPHDGNAPFVDADYWIDNIRECPKENPYASQPRVWELYPPERIKGVSPRTLQKIAALQAPQPLEGEEVKAPQREVLGYFPGGLFVDTTVSAGSNLTSDAIQSYLDSLEENSG